MDSGGADGGFQVFMRLVLSAVQVFTRPSARPSLSRSESRTPRHTPPRTHPILRSPRPSEGPSPSRRPRLFLVPLGDDIPPPLLRPESLPASLSISRPPFALLHAPSLGPSHSYPTVLRDQRRRPAFGDRGRRRLPSGSLAEQARI